MSYLKGVQRLSKWNLQNQNNKAEIVDKRIGDFTAKAIDVYVPVS